jgi:AraC-like DNA-binding protein
MIITNDHRRNDKNQRGELKDARELTATHPCTTDLGLAIVHQSIKKDCELRSSFRREYKKMWPHYSKFPTSVYVICALKGNISFNADEEAQKILHQGEFMLANSDRLQSNTFLPPAGEFHVVQISFPQAMLDEMKQAFPWLKLATCRHTGITFVDWQPAPMTPVMLNTIYTLTRSPFEPTHNIVFLKNIFHEFLFLMLRSIESTGEKERHLSSYEIQIGQRAHRLIMQNIRQHLSIPEVATAVGIGWRKLCEVFKQVYGVGIYECLLAERMRLAKEMVTETHKPFTEIASQVGYTYRGFFETYTRFHHHTPGAARELAGVD